MKEVFDWIYSIVVALFLAMLIHIFLFVPTKVSGESMYPTLDNGQYLIVSKISHVLREMPDYGDIVIIDSRTRRERSWIDDLTEPMNNYIAIFDRTRQEHSVWDFMTARYGATDRSWTSPISMSRWNSPWTGPTQCRMAWCS